MKEAFVKTYYPIARKTEKQTGIPALFALAQSALESGWGQHTPGNMFFGLKTGSGRNYGGWTGTSQLIPTTEYATDAKRKFPYIYPGYPIQSGSKWKYKIKDYFKAYPTPYHAFLDWAGLLSKLSRYRQAMSYTSDPYRFADEIAKAGYATAPGYADRVKKVMSEIQRIIKQIGLDKGGLVLIWPLSVIFLGTGLILFFTYRKHNHLK